MTIEKKIFVSYNWDNSEIVDEIDGYFLSIGLPLIRDKKDLQYKSSLKKFMKKIRSSDYVIMIISDSFLKSSNCMYEVLELVKDDNYKSKTLQILIPGTNIFSSSEKFHYINYWNQEHDILESKIEKIQLSDSNVLIKELKHIVEIKSNIGSFLEFLTEENCLDYASIKANTYKPLTDVIGFKPIKNDDRLVSINADVYHFITEGIRWMAFIGKIDNLPYEIYVGKEGDYAFPEYRTIDQKYPISLVLDQHDKTSGRIDLKYRNKDDGYLYTHEGINRVFIESEVAVFTKIIGSLLRSKSGIDVIIDVLDEMYVMKHENPYLWKESIQDILLKYKNK